MAKKIIVLILMIMVVMPLLAQRAAKKHVTFFAPGSVYIYLQGSWARVNPDHQIYGPKVDAFAPILGVGCRVINFNNRIFMNLEFDYSWADFDSDYSYSKKTIRFYNFKMGGEFLFSRKKLAFLVNIGIGSITYPDLEYFILPEGDSELTMLVEIGVRVALSKHLSFRTDLRLFAEPDSNEFDYYYDDDTRLIASALSVGLQFNF